MGKMKGRIPEEGYPKGGLAFDSYFDSGTFPDTVLGAVAVGDEFELFPGGDDGKGRGVVSFGVTKGSRDVRGTRQEGVSVEESDRFNVVVEVIGVRVFVPHFDRYFKWLTGFGRLGTVDEGGMTIDEVFFGFAIDLGDVGVCVDLGHGIPFS